jgi:hypothetical protein
LNEFSRMGTTKYKTPMYSSWHAQSRIDGFLAFRCSREFLVDFIEEHPDLLNRVSKPGLFLSAVSEVDLAIRLHEFGLLPEEHRKIFVETVSEYAIEGEDLYIFESARIQSVFTSDERAHFHERVVDELLPKLGDVRLTWESNRDSEQRSDEWLQPLLDSFSALKTEFPDQPSIVDTINLEIQRGEEWIAEHSSDESHSDRPTQTFGDVESTGQPISQFRGIFDDIDE